MPGAVCRRRSAAGDVVARGRRPLTLRFALLTTRGPVGSCRAKLPPGVAGQRPHPPKRERERHQQQDVARHHDGQRGRLHVEQAAAEERRELAWVSTSVTPPRTAIQRSRAATSAHAGRIQTKNCGESTLPNVTSREQQREDDDHLVGRCGAQVPAAPPREQVDGGHGQQRQAAGQVGGEADAGGDERVRACGSTPTSPSPRRSAARAAAACRARSRSAAGARGGTGTCTTRLRQT